jgi:hypothetical protein
VVAATAACAGISSSGEDRQICHLLQAAAFRTPPFVFHPAPSARLIVRPILL